MAAGVALRDELTLGEVVAAPCCAEWQLRALLRRLLAEPLRVGPFGVSRRADLPAVRRALAGAGHLRDAAPRAEEVSPDGAQWRP